MSIHSSLKITGGMSGQRNVWSRMERILALKKNGRWQDGDKVVGLPKVRTSFKIKAKKKDDAAADGKPAAKPAAAKPAAGKPAAGKAGGAAPAAAAAPAGKKK